MRFLQNRTRDYGYSNYFDREALSAGSCPSYGGLSGHERRHVFDLKASNNTWAAFISQLKPTQNPQAIVRAKRKIRRLLTFSACLHRNKSPPRDRPGKPGQHNKTKSVMAIEWIWHTHTHHPRPQRAGQLPGCSNQTDVMGSDRTAHHHRPYQTHHTHMAWQWTGWPN